MEGLSACWWNLDLVANTRALLVWCFFFDKRGACSNLAYKILSVTKLDRLKVFINAGILSELLTINNCSCRVPSWLKGHSVYDICNEFLFGIYLFIGTWNILSGICRSVMCSCSIILCTHITCWNFKLCFLVASLKDML